MSDALTYGSLFTGIGGLDLGVEAAGFVPAWQIEVDEWCRALLHRRWPAVPQYGDIASVDLGSLPPVDLICGGFPCQPISIAGLQRAQADERWLWPEFERAIRALRPRYVIVENVPALLVVNGGSAAGEVLGGLAACGYDARWDVLGADASAHLIGAIASSSEPGSRIWPTPRATASEQRTYQRTPSQQAHAHGAYLQVEVLEVERQRHRHWLTPQANEDAAGTINGQMQRMLTHQAKEAEPALRRAGGQLNPDWVEWLMGLPIGWSDLEAEPIDHGGWARDPAEDGSVPRLRTGLKGKAARLKGIGNAVVPVMGEWAARDLLERAS